MAARMTDAQHATLTAINTRPTAAPDVAYRYTDTRTVTTLIAMAKPSRGWVTLNWAVVDGARRIVSATITNAGRHALAAETANRAAAADLAARIDRWTGLTPPAPGTSADVVLASVTTRVDPFALAATGPAGAEIPF